jgi:N-methylhydantoinase A
MAEALIPVHSGVLSALGMLAAPRGRHLSRTWNILLEEADGQSAAAGFAQLAQHGAAELQREGVAAGDIRTELSVDLRYRGQSATLNVPWRDARDAAASFHHAHAARYGHRLDLPVELVNLRAAIFGPRPELTLRGAAAGGGDLSAGTVRIYGSAAAVPVRERETLRGSESLNGPALIVDAYSTAFLAPGWRCRADSHGNLFLTRQH